MYTSRQLSADGIELTWALNHLAPFLLTTLLLDRLRASAPRASSRRRRRPTRAPHPFRRPKCRAVLSRLWPLQASKLANILFTVELARRLEGSGVTAHLFPSGIGGEGFNRNNGI